MQNVPDDIDEQTLLDSLVSTVPPSAEVKVRLLASIGAGRFEPFAPQLGVLFDLTLDRTHELLGLVERAASWAPILPGTSMLHLRGGPAAAGAHCVFLKLAPGATFPQHGHRGEESALVMCGRVRDLTTDQAIGAGETWVMPGGTSHALRNDGDIECICAVRSTGGITLS